MNNLLRIASGMPRGNVDPQLGQMMSGNFSNASGQDARHAQLPEPLWDRFAPGFGANHRARSIEFSGGRIDLAEEELVAATEVLAKNAVIHRNGDAH